MARYSARSSKQQTIRIHNEEPQLIKVKLTRIKSNHTNLRTDEIVGVAVYGLPQVGRSFALAAEPLDPTKDLRGVLTTPVTELDGNTFKTANSEYKFEVLND